MSSLSGVELDAYLARIGHSADVRPDLATLRSVHRAHLAAIPYEALDIQLSRGVSLNGTDVVAKLVTNRRGGFCYEQNALMARALRAIGFTVTYVEGAVMRAARGDDMWRNHMPLLVDLPEGRFLADAGLGDGFLEPLPLTEGVHADGIWSHRLEFLAEGVWRCHPDPRGSVESFDFRTEPREVADFVEACAYRADSPDSPFKRVLVVQQPRPESKVVVRGCTHIVVTAGERTERVLADPDAFGAVLSAEFGLSLPGEDVRALWTQAWAKHLEWLAEKENTPA
ncbi:arylamine N-acetyltransferase family protein [Phytomonospora endophytica]|uniref:N-hydroxyarylamine O-acetyltransferase n=1 Tax=Phytomonospora endophytica TaxID=714109 RepID=A0A841G4H1_9ACTN|nr:arylamine N-acetyltransferase [Phytomonospora endophytica]MBB6039010.1 N-hydroxyarylamine O-acetyltransferase [Phytomonospora endophytica]